jgi:hypothetical protein
MTDTQWGFRGLLASIDTTGGRRENLTQRNLLPGDVFWLELIQVGSNKASKE